MLCQRAGQRETSPLECPCGRGVMLQVHVDRLEPALVALSDRGWPLHAEPREVGRRRGDREGGARELWAQDPDGYLAMAAGHIGKPPLP